MDEQSVKQALRQLAEEAVPVSGDPWTTIRLRALASDTISAHTGVQSMHSLHESQRMKRPVRIAMAFVSLMIVMAALILATPHGRAWAQRTFAFFTRAGQEAFPIPEAQLTAVAAPDDAAQPTAPASANILFPENCGGQDPAQDYLCQIAFAESRLGFQVKLPSIEESRLFFSGLLVDTQRQSVRASFGYEGYPGTESSVWIEQGKGDFPQESEWQSVPEEYVQPVTVSGLPGEYVEGGFVARPGASQATWATDVPMGRLRWMEGDTWFEIFKAGQPERVTYMDRAGVVKLAESLTPVIPSR